MQCKFRIVQPFRPTPEMLFRFLITSLFLCQYLTQALAIREYVAGDTLYVWAASGLSLRREASLSAEKMLSIPYGTPIIAQSDKFTNVADDIRVEAAPGYTMNDSVSAAVYLTGRFAKVTYQGKTGYLFDGYLSKWPPMRYETIKYRDGTSRRAFEDFSAYARRTFGVLHEWQDSASYSYIYKNGVTEIRNFLAEEDLEDRVVLPSFSWEEVFLIFNLWQSYEQTVRKYPSINTSEYSWKFRRRATQAGQVLEFDDGGSYFSIQCLDAQHLVILYYTFGGC